MRGYLAYLLSIAIFSGAVDGVLIADDEFPTIVNSEQDRNAVPMSAEQATKGIELPAGFHATLIAAEPDVQNPIAMSWDSRGRLWIAENYTYAQSNQRFDLSMRDRVVVFADSDHNGSLDQRTVFTDQLQMLTSVEVGLGGVWLMCPPQVLFIPDADQDLKPDGPATVVLDGFTVAQANYHNFANGLRFGLMVGCMVAVAVHALAGSVFLALRMWIVWHWKAVSGDIILNANKSKYSVPERRTHGVTIGMTTVNCSLSTPSMDISGMESRVLIIDVHSTLIPILKRLTRSIIMLITITLTLAKAGRILETEPRTILAAVTRIAARCST